MEQIILQGTTPEALARLISESVKSQLEDFKKELVNQTEKENLLTREQVLELLQINSSTLWHWQNKGKIQVYKFANKCYYKRSELMNCLTPLKK
jgi:DNA-binding NtrC family response regulator